MGHRFHLSKDRRVSHQQHGTHLIVFLTRGLVVGLVPEPIKFACGNRLHILLWLARLHCFGRLLGYLVFILLTLFLFVFLFSLLFSLRSSMRSTIIRTWNGDSFGLERLFDLRQLLDEGSELFNVEGDSLEKSDDQLDVRSPE